MKKLTMLCLCFWLVGIVHTAQAQFLQATVSSFNGQFDPTLIDVGNGPVSTGPITVTLQSGMPSQVLWDLNAETMYVDLYLKVDAPLLSAIGSSSPTLRVQEIGPMTWGVDDLTGELGGWSSLAGGGIIDPGTPFADGAFYNDNIYDIGTVNAKVPVNVNPPPKPPKRPAKPKPFPPPTTPSPRPLPDGKKKASLDDIINKSPTLAQVGWADNGILRLDNQPDDLILSGTGTMTLTKFQVIPEPSAYLTFGFGALMMTYAWKRRLRSNLRFSLRRRRQRPVEDQA